MASKGLGIRVVSKHKNGRQYGLLPTDANEVSVMEVSRHAPSDDEEAEISEWPLHQILYLAESPTTLGLRLQVLVLLWCACVYSWVQGAFRLPTMTIHVMPGTPFEATYQRSLFMTLMDLYHNQTYLALTILGFFSVCVPTAKLLCTGLIISRLFKDSVGQVYGTYRRLIWSLSHIASYQLIDLYVGVLVVVHFNSDSTHAHFNAGFYWFYFYCMTSLVMSVTLDSVFHRVVAAEDGQHSERVVFAQFVAKDPRIRRKAAEVTWRDRVSAAVARFVPSFLSFAVPAPPPSATSLEPVHVLDTDAPEEEEDEFADLGAPVGANGTPSLSETLYSYMTLLDPANSSLEGDGEEPGIRRKDSRKKSPRPLSADAERALTEEAAIPPSQRLPFFLDVASVWLYSAAFTVMLATCATSPMLEVHTIYNGVSIDRRVHAVLDIFATFLPMHTALFVAIPLLLMNLVLPLLYLCIMLAMAMHMPTVEERRSSSGNLPRLLCTIADALRPWATTDVFCIAAFVFIVSFKDGRTLIEPTPDWRHFYSYLGIGFSLFYLRWWPESGQREPRVVKSGLVMRACLWLVFWLATCYLIDGGLVELEHTVEGEASGWKHEALPGSVEQFSFNGLDSVCHNALPLVNSTLRSMLPNTYGNCSDKATHPPQPCSGDKPLYEMKHGHDFVQAIWASGLNTIRLTDCKLWKDDVQSPSGVTMYNLRLAGQFDKIRLFLHAAACADVVGCTYIYSPRHCCGDNLNFEVKFQLPCKTRPHSKDSIRSMNVAKFRVDDPMMVDTDFNFFGSDLKLKVLDIGPRVQSLLQDTIENFLKTSKLKWAGEEMHVPQLINHLIAYNSPGSAGTCE
eukprot:TRINITY_DN34141_c0_g1_i1.p1 TRINITY_DN34141_c0_g1~~TRINITY_DN34141_c0_g1_i1.p1  ORF type:complete len:849 (+),score=159.84 TRINITY_DN34141_c0_g1_i1:104-2650(+)